MSARKIKPHAFKAHAWGDQPHCAKCGQPRKHANHHAPIVSTPTPITQESRDWCAQYSTTPEAMREALRPFATWMIEHGIDEIALERHVEDGEANVRLTLVRG